MSTTRSLTLVLFLALALGALGGEPRPELKIRGGAFANWWTLGDTVTFKRDSGFPPEDAVKLQSRVFDSDGKELANSTLDIATFLDSGWSWKPEQPGFLSVKFSLLDAKGVEHAATETFLYGKEPYRYDSHQFAVLPTAPRPPKECPPILGASVGWCTRNKAQAEEQLRLGALAGIHFIRLQPLCWANIEKSDGVYDWTEPDWWMEAAQRLGIKVAVNPWGTPKWAASDQSTKVTILPKYMMSMPVKTEYWTRFLKTAAERYPQVHDWELWNEAHELGLSCFWSGTPEQFLELNRTGHAAIKAVRPGDVVWNNCPSPKLYEFMLRNGGAAYFDKIEPHGKWMDFDAGYGAIAKNFGVSKPWGSLEWHAILTSASEPLPSEGQLTRNMLLDLMNLVRTGAEMAAIHHVLDRGMSNEMLESARKSPTAWSAHTAGLFKGAPYIEPRLPVVALRNFMDNFSGKIVYRGGFTFDNDKQCAALLSSDAGDLLVFWLNAKEPERLDKALAQALQAKSILLDWDGRARPEGAALTLLPNHVYWIKNPATEAAANWTKAQVLKKTAAAPAKLNNSVNGLYRGGRLFDAALNVLEPERLRWQNATVYVPLMNRPKAEGFAAKFAAAFDDKGMDLLIDVTDSTHAQSSDGEAQWVGDGAQFCLDTAGQGVQENCVEFCAALGPKGPVLWKQSAARLDGQLPTNFTAAGNIVEHAAVKIDVRPGGLRYKIHVDASELYPLSLSGKEALRFSLLVNNNNGNGREGWLEWASGVGGGKMAELYGNLTPDVGAAPLLRQDGLKEKWGDATLSAQPDSVRLESKAGDTGTRGVAALSANGIQLVAGVRYAVEFQARGDVTLTAMMTCKADDKAQGERLDLLRGVKLTPQWQPFKAAFIAPANSGSSSLALFAWKQSGSFEIKDFLLAPASE